MMTYCCKSFGKEYLISIIDLVLDYICSDDKIELSYEVDPTRLVTVVSLQNKLTSLHIDY